MTRPLCRMCGKPMPYWSTSTYTRVKTLRSKQDCQRTTNLTVTSLSYHQDTDWNNDTGRFDNVGERYVYSFHTWDGESYQGHRLYNATRDTVMFCSTQCASALGVSAAEHHGLGGKAYFAAIAKQKEKAA